MNLPRGSKRGAVGGVAVLLLGATFAFGYGDDGVREVTGAAETITGAAGDREAAERAALEETGGGEVISPSATTAATRSTSSRVHSGSP